MPRHAAALAAATVTLVAAWPGAAATWTLNTWAEPFDYESPARTIQYSPVKTARRPWQLCVCYPHLKDSYWLSVNYGMVQAARRLGVRMRLFTAGGYPNLSQQKDQVRECVRRDADAIIVGTVSYDGLSDTIVDATGDIPVIAAVNDIASRGIDAKVGVPWKEMGAKAGRFIAKRHPEGAKPVKVAWFPGPRDGGWVPFVRKGFERSIAKSSARIVTTKFGDTGTEIQLLLLEEALDAHPNVDYVAGAAPTATAAVGLLRARGRLNDIGLVADYFTHGVFRGIKRGRILAAPTDFPVLQGRLAIDMAVRLLEDTLRVRHVGPPIRMVTQANVDSLRLRRSLSPASFTPTFTVAPRGRPTVSTGGAADDGSASAPQSYR